MLEQRLLQGREHDVRARAAAHLQRQEIRERAARIARELSRELLQECGWQAVRPILAVHEARRAGDQRQLTHR